jgi:hypothetical protein
MKFKEPSGDVQVAVMNLIKDHAKTPEEVKRGLDHDHAKAGWTYDDVLKCLRFLEQHNRVRSSKRESGDYEFKKEEIV